MEQHPGRLRESERESQGTWRIDLRRYFPEAQAILALVEQSLRSRVACQRTRRSDAIPGRPAARQIDTEDAHRVLRALDLLHVQLLDFFLVRMPVTCRKHLVFSYFCDSLVVDELLVAADTSPITEEAVMSVPARKIELEHKMNERSALHEKVDHIQSDVTELKADVKRIEARLDHKIDAVDEKVDAVAASLAEHRIETERSFGKVREEISTLRNDLTKEIGGLRCDMAKEVGSLRDDLTKEVGGIRSDLTKEASSLRSDMAKEVGSLRDDLTKEVGGLRSDLAKEVGGIRSDLTKEVGCLRTDTTREFGALRGEIKDVVAILRRERIIFIGWTVTALIAGIGAFSTFLAPQAPSTAQEAPAQGSASASKANEPLPALPAPDHSHPTGGIDAQDAGG
jgi:hypothetical protein